MAQKQLEVTKTLVSKPSCSYDDRATEQLLTRCKVKNYNNDINYDDYNSNDNNNGGGAFIT